MEMMRRQWDVNNNNTLIFLVIWKNIITWWYRVRMCSSNCAVRMSKEKMSSLLTPDSFRQSSCSCLKQNWLCRTIVQNIYVQINFADSSGIACLLPQTNNVLFTLIKLPKVRLKSYMFSVFPFFSRFKIAESGFWQFLD